MKNIIVTGASTGIGFSTAKHFADLGYTVFAIARTGSKLDILSKSVTSGKIIPLVADLSSDQSISVIQQTTAEIEQIDIVINNAGVLLNKPFFETSLSDWDFQFQVNLYGPLRILHAIRTKLKQGTHVVNIGSMGGYQGSNKFPGISAYSVSKGALGILSECLSKEFEDIGVIVNCLALGAVQTKMLEEAFPGYKAPVTVDTMGSYIADFALKAGELINGKVIPVALNNPG
ncbi:MAG: SDR family oxidoreductase [Balneolales bacterium]|nr:SDR family oxidoreductase [Balneolales bacterium]